MPSCETQESVARSPNSTGVERPVLTLTLNSPSRFCTVSQRCMRMASGSRSSLSTTEARWKTRSVAAVSAMKASVGLEPSAPMNINRVTGTGKILL